MATHLLSVRDLSADVEVYVVRDIVFTFYKLLAVRSVINDDHLRRRTEIDRCKVCGNKVRQFL
jgi:hypothetical protein